MRNPQGRLHTLLAVLSCAASLTASASTFTVDFNPASPVNTNGWDLSQSAAQEKTSQTPAGRKLSPDTGKSAFIESPAHPSRIRAVSVSFKCVNAKNGNAAKVEAFGRTSESDEYKTVLFATGLPGTPTNICSSASATTLDDFDCRQVKIVYTKDNSSLNGNLVVTSVTFTDEALRAETPTNLRTEVVDAATRRVRVRWDLADGLADSKWRTFTTATSGGVAASETLWRESFDGVPALNAAKEIDAAKLAEFGFAGDWQADYLRQPATAGALLIGWEKGITGSLATPPLGQTLSAGNILVLRAASRDVASGVMPVSVVAGAVTSCVAEVAVTKAARDCLITMPALSATDRILVQSITNQSSRATLVYDLAVCAPGAYQPEIVVTNAATAATAVSDSTAEVTVPDAGTNLWLEVCATYDGEDSDWTKPFLVTLSDSSDDGDGSDDDGDGGAAGLAAPGNVRAGTLSDGNVRLGWTTPDGATNVQLRVWTLSSSGGLAAAKADDILWRESFTNAPAKSNTSNVLIDTGKELADYTDKGESGWDISAFTRTYLSTCATAIRIGTTDNPGAIVSKPLAASGEGLSLVVTAKRGSGKDNSGVILRPSLLSDAATTNTLGQTTLSAEFAEYAFSISSPLTGTESLLLESVIGTPKDGRIIIYDVALVRGYSPVSATTNEVLAIDLGAREEYDIAADGAEAVFYATLRAQDAAGATSEWTPPLALDPSALGVWKPRYLTPDRHGKVSATMDWTSLPATTETKLDVSDSPFRFLLDGSECLTISRDKDVTKTFSAGVYVCTNVFERDWLVLTPYSPENKSDVRTAEMRVAIEPGEFALRKVSVSGEFAQLGASNNVERTLLFQWRSIARDGAATAWHDFGEYNTAYTAADAPSDLSGTVSNVTAEATLQASVGARVEVRVFSERQEGQKIAPLGFRDFRIRAESASRAILFIVR